MADGLVDSVYASNLIERDYLRVAAWAAARRAMGTRKGEQET